MAGFGAVVSIRAGSKIGSQICGVGGGSPLLYDRRFTKL